MSVAIPASVEEVGAGAFFQATNLESVTFAEGSRLRVIGWYCFGSSGLKSIEIPASVVEVGFEAFAHCKGLKVVSFATGSQLRQLGKNVFKESPKLKLLRIPSGFDCAIPSGCKLKRV